MDAYDGEKNDESLAKEYHIDPHDMNNEIFTIDELAKKVRAELEVGHEASIIIASNILGNNRITTWIAEVHELISDIEESYLDRNKIRL